MSALKLYNQAVKSEKSCQYADARSLYTKLIEEYKDSLYAEQAESNLADMGDASVNYSEAEQCIKYYDDYLRALASIHRFLGFVLVISGLIYLLLCKRQTNPTLATPPAFQ